MTGPDWPGGRPAELYDYLSRLVPGDVGEWLATVATVRGEGRLLYVGIGTGRRGIELAMAGWQVHGVERDAAPLHELKRRLAEDPRVEAARDRLTVEHARMEDSAADGPFDAVIVPDLAFAQALDPDAQRELLVACAKRCRAGGAVVVDAANPAPFHAAALTGRPVFESGPVADTEPGGETVWRSVRIELTAADAREQRFEHVARYTVEYPDGDTRTFEDPAAVRWTSPYELRLLARDAGLRMTGGSFERLDAPVLRVGLRPA